MTNISVTPPVVVTPSHDTPPNEPPKIDIGQRVSIVNALMKEDREEVRAKQEGIIRLAYYFTATFIAVAVYARENPTLRHTLIYAELLLVALYLAAFITFRKWLSDGRACLNIREAYYRRPDLLHATRFDPLRAITDEDRVGFRESVVFPFVVTIVAGAGMIVYMITAL